MNIGEAFLYNLIITICSCILPILVGAIYLPLAKKNPEKKRIAPIIALIPESISPYIAVVVLYAICYANRRWFLRNGFSLSSDVYIALSLATCFIAYIPKRQNRNYSVRKNLIVNSLGLFSTVFMWSLAVDGFGEKGIGLGHFAYKSLFYSSGVQVGEIILPVVISFLFVLMLKGIKYWVEFHLLRNDAPKVNVESLDLDNDKSSGGIIMANRSKVVSALLAFFLGTTGAHRYYLGYKKQGIIQTCGFVSLIIGYAMYVPAMMDGSAGMLLFSVLFLLYGAGIGIWAFVDFIRILTGGLTPADGSPWEKEQVVMTQVVMTQPVAAEPAATQPAMAMPVQNSDSNAIEILEKLAKLHEQGILTDEEFQQKKADILAKM